MMSENNGALQLSPTDNAGVNGVAHNNIGDTIRIRRPPRVVTNELGRTIWMSEVKPVELELELEPDTVVNASPYESARPMSI
jgi:hypothetical protein